MKKTLNILLLLSFIITLAVALTGVNIHKPASVIFLVLIFIHVAVYRKKMSLQRWILLLLILLSFASGLFGMIFRQYPFIMTLHSISTIVLIFFTAIHIYIYRKKLKV